MKRVSALMCAIGIALSCQAQFFSIGEVNEERPKTVIVNNPLLESIDSLTEPKQPTEAMWAVPGAFNDFWQQMILMWTSVSLPLDNLKQTSGFGMRMHPVYHKRMSHNGIDFSASKGTKTYAMFDGIIEKVGYDARSGNYIVLRTKEYRLSYCHLSKQLVKAGDKVKAGDVLGLCGSTGCSTGPHLHLGVRKLSNMQWVSPNKVIDEVRETRNAVLSLIRKHGGQRG